MWSRHFIALADEFSFTARGSYWPNHEWLSEILFFALYRLGGLPGVTLLAAACVTTAVGLSWRLTPGHPTLKLLVMTAAIPSVVFVWTVRPHVFTLLMLMTCVHLVLRVRYWPLPILFALWANLHGGVALGIVTLGAATCAEAWAGDRRRAMRLFVVSAVCFAATLATPLGMDLWKTIPESIQKSMANGIQEWHPPILGWRDLSFWLFAAAMLVATALRWRRITTREQAVLVAVALALLPLALRYSRNITPFILVAVPALGSLVPTEVYLHQRRDRRQRYLVNKILLATCVVACTVGVLRAWVNPAPRLQWTPISQQIVDGIRACPGRLYNRFDDGGYVIWFAPEVPVFVDNRQDPYRLAFVQEHLRREQSGDFETVFGEYSLTCAFLPPQSPTAGRLLAAGWRTAAADSHWLVLQQR
jgi:hypothetical protein